MATLYLVPTPLGHLSDVTLRAIQVLRSVGCIAAEDTRRTRKLLEHHGVTTRPVSLHRFNEEKAAGWVLEKLASGEDVAYVTDAGTPGVSDPGARLVRRIRAAGHEVIPLPGPCAAVTALSASGWEGPFAFEGYLARKGKERRDQLSRMASRQQAVILYEAPGRLRATLRDLEEQMPHHRILLAREMTKVHEQYLLGPASSLLQQLPDPVKGEITLVLIPPEREREKPGEEALMLAAGAAAMLAEEGTRLKSACTALARVTGLPSRRIYEEATRMRHPGDPPGEPPRRR